MRPDSSLGLQLKRLLSGVSGHGAQHLQEIETDLGQTAFLLHTAIEKLSVSFMAIHEAAQAQQQACESILPGTGMTPELAEKLKAGQSDIEAHVNAAVTALQFQDLTNQLLERTTRRVLGLREALGQLGAGVAGLDAEHGADELAARLERINAALEEQSLTLDSALLKAVGQTHMESGDIELF